MKAVIVSDSHGLTDELAQIVMRHRHEVNLFIHCGDSELPAEADAIAPFAVVRGNCDWTAAFPDERIEEADGVRLFVTHGHLYGVKTSLLRLYYRAKEAGANIVCFGHSHLAGAEQIDDVLFINPGSIALPRGRKEKTYAVLEMDRGRTFIQFCDIGGRPIPGLEKTFSI
ncbi:metallophosphatase [Geobacillus genomosp. 3]|uniref:Phosphoesterase n=1 Tax=Geobacillus genomosp. 3 TaxID=1921421 RepID=S6A3D2_GEOG3|nr:metallophosphoesterase [Geobacillus genomosp. 3]AGT33001.1 metallophosphatase [Geobacillus genomosp. 3]